MFLPGVIGSNPLKPDPTSIERDAAGLASIIGVANIANTSAKLHISDLTETADLSILYTAGLAIYSWQFSQEASW